MREGRVGVPSPIAVKVGSRIPRDRRSLKDPEVNEPDKVALCIRANSRGRIQFHYKLPRRLTVRECARVQTFPDEFVFPYTTQRNLTLIGNAVPPILAHAVAKSVAKFIDAVDNGKDRSHAVTLRREYVSAENGGISQAEFAF